MNQDKPTAALYVDGKRIPDPEVARLRNELDIMTNARDGYAEGADCLTRERNALRQRVMALSDWVCEFCPGVRFAATKEETAEWTK
jgi:hypothetical protein